MMRFATVVLLGLMVVSKQLLAAPDVLELTSVRDEARDAVILLTDDVLKQYVVGRSRPYTVVIFFSAEQVSESNPNLRLDDLRKEYGLAAKAFATGPDADKIFFFEAALEKSQTPFAMLQVNSLPCVVRIPPGLSVGASTVELGKGDKMLPDTVGTRNYPWPAETFVEFMGIRHGLKAAEVDRPSIYKSPLFPVLVLASMLATAYLMYKVYALSLLQHAAIWAVLSLVVFWFSVSGGMYNIIRGVPFFIRDRKGNLQFFLTGRQGQLGAEGFTLGSLYLVVSGSLAFVAFLAPRISNRWLRDVLSVTGAVLAAGSIYQTFMLWTMKTGYQHVLHV
ncbi:hypothetical protein VOLCADRAFT_105485 [Volvox carteri f. nagariensis]|uniref:Dolichyl-diphosphooligosaccharide--protein glycosyltransferase subunit 3 n=1 Tax=Volvox carteri f. nagariensis TaxID=3068 RepID=D8U150_VOLCA|nr:uncharacterized protein VOLCADRAFT_105485 [Volvox carteri f. nagariensis]EFJ46497.1 hypothetical protein VOLCADRAFT_105485 [Volvox carteri f. nagariensis]|eukprot:XP_002952354.1 hypothetical protein VOLCADRAFT_105485 [Volvox carteri f. nagariensis]